MNRRFLLLSLAVLILDHGTKWFVQTRMGLHDSIEIIPDYLRISYVQNTGVAFGLLADVQSPWKPYLLGAMAIAAAIIILMYSARIPSNRVLLQTALAVTLGGILGNFLDRIVHGFVVDFIEFHIQDMFHWPTFNVADSAISTGIALLLIDTVLNPDAEENQPKASLPDG
jgi:signal peptidase II